MTLNQKFGAPFLNTYATKIRSAIGGHVLVGCKENTITLKCMEMSTLKNLKLHVSCTWKFHFDIDIIKIDIKLIIFHE